MEGMAPWSFPGPVLRILLQPKWTHKTVERLGIGVEHPEEQWEALAQNFHKKCCTCSWPRFMR